MSEPTEYGGLAHRWSGFARCDERTDRIRRFGSSVGWRMGDGRHRCPGVRSADAIGGRLAGCRSRRRRPAQRHRPRHRRRSLGPCRGARALAGSTGVRHERRAADVPPLVRRRTAARGTTPMGDPRRDLLPGRRLARRRLPGRPRGLLLQPQLRRDVAVAIRRRPRAGHRSDLLAAGRDHRASKHHRRVPEPRRHRPEAQPRRALASGVPVRHRTGSDRSTPSAVSRCRRQTSASSDLHSHRQRPADAGDDAHLRRWRAGRRTAPVDRCRQERLRVDGRHHRSRAVVAQGARRSTAHRCRRRSRRRRRRQRPSRAPYGSQTSDLGRLGLLGER